MEDNAYKSESMHDGIPKKTLLEAVVDFFEKDLVQYIVKRILMFIPTLLLISILVFFVIQLPPGDYVSAHIAALASEGEFVDADYAATRALKGISTDTVLGHHGVGIFWNVTAWTLERV